MALAALVLAAALAGCADGTSSEAPREPAAALVEVPDVTGLAADEARSEIESAGDLTASFDREPDDPALCTVDDQDETGEVDAGTEVILALSCQITVPDVTGLAADEAQSEIESAGELTASFDLEPDDPAACTVDDQDPGADESVDQGADVTVYLSCDSGGGGGETSCDPSYAGQCLDPNSYDYDCSNGSGNGPDYVEGPVDVVGDDHFDLDRDGDGIGCVDG